MAKLVWDKIGDRKYETGVDHGVLYKYFRQKEILLRLSAMV